MHQPNEKESLSLTQKSTVWLEMDQSQLDAAYDQRVYAPNMPQILERYAINSEVIRDRLGDPHRFTYGSSLIEGLEIYLTKHSNAPINRLVGI